MVQIFFTKSVLSKNFRSNVHLRLSFNFKYNTLKGVILDIGFTFRFIVNFFVKYNLRTLDTSINLLSYFFRCIFPILIYQDQLPPLWIKWKDHKIIQPIPKKFYYSRNHLNSIKIFTPIQILPLWSYESLLNTYSSNS